MGGWLIISSCAEIDQSLRSYIPYSPPIQQHTMLPSNVNTSQKPFCGQTPFLRTLQSPSNCDGLDIYQNVASCKNKLVNLKAHYCERYHAIGFYFILLRHGIIATAKMIIAEISSFLKCPASSRIIAEHRILFPMN
jgi:hypothetical protein